jgi:hypothetical protein
MQNHRHPHLKVLWERECIDGKDTADLLRQIVAIVLKDDDEVSACAGIDMQSPMGINEGVPVENTNKS